MSRSHISSPGEFPVISCVQKLMDGLFCAEIMVIHAADCGILTLADGCSVGSDAVIL